MRETSALLAEIDLEIGEAACDTDRQCHTIAIGAKACGGPDAYRAWSNKVSDTARLAKLATRYRGARQAESMRGGTVSNCVLVPDPGAVCRPRVADGMRVCQPGRSAADQAR